MKRKFAFLMATILLSSLFTACGDSNKNAKSDSSNGVLSGACAYVSLRSAFSSFSGKEFNPDGDAYKEIINDSESSAEEKLQYMEALYFDGTDFMQFAHYNRNNDYIAPTYYSGTYNVEDNGNVAVDYIHYHSYKASGEEQYFNLETEETNMSYGRHLGTIAGNMHDAKENNCFFDLPNAPICGIDMNPYLPFSFGYYYLSEETGEPYLKQYNLHKDVNSVELYSKGKYLLLNQVGYSFQGDVSRDEFALLYDHSIVHEGSDIKMQIDFHSDHTWVNNNKNENGTKTGKWEWVDNNLLLIYPPKYVGFGDDIEELPMYNGTESLLYLDLENQEIYIPFYIRCDDILDTVKEFKKSKDN